MDPKQGFECKCLIWLVASGHPGKGVGGERGKGRQPVSGEKSRWQQRASGAHPGPLGDGRKCLSIIPPQEGRSRGMYPPPLSWGSIGWKLPSGASLLQHQQIKMDGVAKVSRGSAGHARALIHSVHHSFILSSNMSHMPFLCQVLSSLLGIQS